MSTACECLKHYMTHLERPQLFRWRNTTLLSTTGPAFFKVPCGCRASCQPAASFSLPPYSTV
ncbi:hypothetical protein CB0940_11717 [Cercospora beticola]|uniref:Uncharacterized protein n=1 Tax=Cercospora beticola TaxID=122368 RepID=A0A2G5IDI7_CERBT|nr:hypothetical protein CB0940_11717 [Cercospora beticola]PIB02810.1 hypothetical protein CB0940_11717 [Cercospora beticola]